MVREMAVVVAVVLCILLQGTSVIKLKILCTLYHIWIEMFAQVFTRVFRYNDFIVFMSRYIRL